MPLLAMFVARAMMILAVIGSFSMYFYVTVLRFSPLLGRPRVVYLRPPTFQWDRADHRNVIIVTDSPNDPNIIGDLFNQHPKVFYVEQPLYPFEMFKNLNYTRKSEYNGQVRAFLDNLFHCRLNGYRDYLTFLSHPRLSSPRFRLSSKALSSPPLCRKEVSTYTNESDFLKDCPLLNAKWVSIVCARKMHIVLSLYAKRAPGGVLAGLLPLMTSQSMATRVLHFVRDPRAVVWEMVSKDRHSEKNSHQLTTLENKIMKRCVQLNTDSDFLRSLPSDLAQQYQIIRYEDVGRNLVKTADIAFKFAGIDRTAEVNEYVKRQKPGINNDDDSSWRLAMDMRVVAMIDQHCAHVIEKLGYKPVLNKRTLRNLNYSLLDNNINVV
ncbi:carbohydrate sulfotransferase 1-like [Actinia tenebrosa]|uniref:Carbohydrate sulfotransferase 1-like n=1 Tax=Actinia tenebrosa TaxID=6105 RepID=A0A6P8HTN2_ACTTE|nr:carbohydrate sulfotransferase 1-like [Actinia tenebrosa]